jgi:CheY-like chemotaxis protein
MMDGDISVFSQYGKGSVFTATVLQKVKDESPLAVVDAPETKTVLLYEPNILCARSIARSLRNLGVRRRIVSNREEFAAALQRERYSFIFMSAGLYDSALDLLTAFAPQSVPVLLSEFDEAIIRSNVRLIMMPAHIMSIANVLNDTDDADIDARNAGEETIVRFVAPKARMLIVDDNITNLKVAEGLLTPYRLQTDTCTSGAAALRLAQTHKYDLIFMDHMMPEMDGVEAVALIRAMDGEYFRSLPIIALTANAISGMREMLLQNGFSDYLAKPIEIKRLNEVMDKWVPAEKREKQEAPAAHAGVPVFGFEIEGLDVAAGLALTGGAREQYREVLLLCCEDAGERMEALRETPNEAGLARFVIDVHALKGALASIGAKSLSKEAAKLEVAGKEGDLPYISEYLAGFRERLTQLMARIRRAFPEADDPAGAGASEPLDEETLSRLKDALSSENVHSADYCLDALMKTTRDAGTRKLLTEISNMILTASFSEAIQSTESLRERIATPGAAVRNDASRGAT